MLSISIRNVHQALPEALYQLSLYGVRRESRNGPVLMADGPVTTVYHKPLERVIFWPQRDANPFFHMFEALWMLGGRQDVNYLLQFNSNMSSFSDDGKTFNGAYGYRWRHHFGGDQLEQIVTSLKRNPECRRQVLSMWDGHHDQGLDSKDLPCNTQVYFSVNVRGELDMMVCNRSNDIVWGCYGANAVHFSFLLEYLAARIGIPVGRYWQLSNNWHLYLDQHEALMDELAPFAVMPPAPRTCPYSREAVQPFPLIEGDVHAWHDDLCMFLDGHKAIGYSSRFFRRVALPMLHAYQMFKEEQTVQSCVGAAEYLRTNCQATDWTLACIDWLPVRKVLLR